MILSPLLVDVQVPPAWPLPSVSVDDNRQWTSGSSALTLTVTPETATPFLSAAVMVKVPASLPLACTAPDDTVTVDAVALGTGSNVTGWRSVNEPLGSLVNETS